MSLVELQRTPLPSGSGFFPLELEPPKRQSQNADGTLRGAISISPQDLLVQTSMSNTDGNELLGF